MKTVSNIALYLIAVAVTIFTTFPLVSKPASAASGLASQVGKWSASQKLFDGSKPLIPVHLALLPNGKLLAWGRNHNKKTPGNHFSPQQPVYILTRSGNSFSIAKLNAPQIGVEIFCAGHSFFGNGILAIAGGHATQYGHGIRTVISFDWQSPTTFTQLPLMAENRWYPTVNTLASGDVLITSGTIMEDSDQDFNRIPEVYTQSGTRWALTGASRSIYYYPWMFQAPNGKVFFAGPDPLTAYLDTIGTGSWQNVATTQYGKIRSYGTAAMYRPGKVIIVGGDKPSPTGSVELIDLNAASPQWSTFTSVPPARHRDGTLLPDGNFLLTGGTSIGPNNPAGALHEPQLLTINQQGSPVGWQPMADDNKLRIYHSVAILMPDGRVLKMGGDDINSVKFFSPPYLFRGNRPTIDYAPSNIGYGQSFTVGTTQSNSISRVTLLGLGSVTHAFNSGQRFNELTFTHGSGYLNVTAPADPNLAPPGYYMLFILNDNGVPSVAKILKLG